MAFIAKRTRSAEEPVVYRESRRTSFSFIKAKIPTLQETMTVSEKRAGLWGTGDWNRCWEEENTELVHKEVDEHFMKFADGLFAGKEKQKLFFPCCGISPVMKWCYDRGHTIIGVDCSDKALRMFFDVNKIDYIRKAVDDVNGFVYQSKRIRLYCCDINNFTSDVESDFDGIWDSGSLTSINIRDQELYCEIMKSLMGAECRYIVSTVEYDTTLFAGPPHSISRQKVKDLFGEDYRFEILESFVPVNIFGDDFQGKSGNYVGPDEDCIFPKQYLQDFNWMSEPRHCIGRDNVRVFPKKCAENLDDDCNGKPDIKSGLYAELQRDFEKEHTRYIDRCPKDSKCHDGAKRSTSGTSRSGNRKRNLRAFAQESREVDRCKIRRPTEQKMEEEQHTDSLKLMEANTGYMLITRAK